MLFYNQASGDIIDSFFLKHINKEKKNYDYILTCRCPAAENVLNFYIGQYGKLPSKIKFLKTVFLHAREDQEKNECNTSNGGNLILAKKAPRIRKNLG